ncbi:hypothetical protein [Cohnella panacarvi]|uniref:hypothetical protein n=1 Tax=Cohnella panacarvi TaxID=400776 RepID=UPI0004AFFE75|nr:hypothetical protein [Cohnella panacarvi]
MLKIGDSVVYVKDGSKGVVMEVQENLYHVIWEDHFSSWEFGESLRKMEAYPSI